MEELSGMGYIHPFICSLMVLNLMALSGLPPTSGFVAKFYIIASIIQSKSFYWLAVVAIINTVISLYYYFNIARSMFFENESSVNKSQTDYLIILIVAVTSSQGLLFYFYWSQLYNLPAISLRLFNVYGPRSRTSGSYGAVFGVFLAQKLAGRPYTVVGDGQQTRDFTFVSDIVTALIAASETEKSGRIYNVGSGRTVSINCIVDLLGGDKEYIPKRPGEPDCTFADISRITQEIGWKPQVSIEEGVQELLKDMTYWKDAPVWTPKSIGEATEDWFKYLGPVSQD